MPILSQDNNFERSMRDFIRIQNLPWTACTSDIKQFFKGLSMIKGGTLVRNFEAYVAFENPTDIRLAMYRRNILLHGCKLELSVINEVELRKILRETVRRKLDFESMKEGLVAKFRFEDTPRRKIRPTPVLKGARQRSAATSVFLPKEVDYLCDSRSVGDCDFIRMFPRGKRTISEVRRLNPTSVPQTTDMGNLAVFYPEECYAVKRIKREE